MQRNLTREEAILRARELKELLRSERINPITTWDNIIIETYETEFDEIWHKYHLDEEPWLLYGWTKEQYEKECEVIKEILDKQFKEGPQDLYESFIKKFR